MVRLWVVNEHDVIRIWRNNMKLMWCKRCSLWRNILKWTWLGTPYKCWGRCKFYCPACGTELTHTKGEE